MSCVSFSVLMPPDFASKNRTFRLMLHDVFKARSSIIDYVNNLLVVGLFSSLLVKFVDLMLKVNFCRFSFLCFVFRIFNCKTSYFHHN